MITMWAVKEPKGSRPILHFTIKRTRREAISAWLDVWDESPNREWPNWTRRGYRCIRVRVEEIT